MSSKKKTILVTVGTTQFDDLVRCVTADQALQSVANLGYHRLVIQYGKGIRPTTISTKYGIEMMCYDFKSSLREDMLQADLILSHAGAGTVMECLTLHRKLVAVINSKLMHNHQMELAVALQQRGHLYMVEKPPDLWVPEIWEAIDQFDPVAHPAGDEFAFPRLLDDFCGFSNNGDNSKIE
ncbi:beta-1,4-N-acetylglucosaminyltransferase [Fistulifera solaris]|jgi:beta-1,4-N-acetylglucosaminyltransferase|uniref:UDP-N-acetylglucosamine transferase subunit ALG13 n=1 Tax=Fistulifera solaris TaxID=1519565 RepID=A0A1Z5JXH4_FISSO|nr:beta-1,4-N-acetylglucosaminyltransferase [Fistulifera solaris]|eukprot:GAX18599.1 beta-1,4-N-acetylglucosaminyltransferase [Fistulifera solaris]